MSTRKALLAAWRKHGRDSLRSFARDAGSLNSDLLPGVTYGTHSAARDWMQHKGVHHWDAAQAAEREGKQ